MKSATTVDAHGNAVTFMIEAVAVPACRAAIAFGEARYADVVNELMPGRSTFNRFGGSHAQRDVLQRTIVESAIRAGDAALAGAAAAAVR